MMKGVCCVLLAALVASANAYSGGAPDGACESMRPGHRQGGTTEDSDPLLDPKTEEFPFEIITNTEGCYNAGEAIQVKLRRKDSCPPYAIEGLFVQARVSVDDTDAHGTFSSDDDNLQTRDCPTTANADATMNALTHKTKYDVVDSVSFTWTPPADAADGDSVMFVATVVTEFDEFWVKQASAAISFNAECDSSGTLDEDHECEAVEHSSHAEGESSEEETDTAAILSANMAVSVLALMAAILYTFFN